MSEIAGKKDLSESLYCLDFDEFKSELLSGLQGLNYEDEEDVYGFVNKSLKNGNKLSNLMEEYKDYLLNDMRWDNKSNRSYELTQRAKHLNRVLYDIAVVYNKFAPSADAYRFFNFECLLNNFKIKFIYHFNNSNNKFDIDIMTTFIKNYIDDNLFNAVRISLTGDVDLTFEEAVNNFLMEVVRVFKSKLKNTINGNTEIIMKLFKFNILLKQEFGTNCKLYDVIPKLQIQEWIKFEIQLIKDYYTKNFNKTQYQLNDGQNLNKYLMNLFDYFKPFLILETDSNTRYILQFKIMIFQKIFLLILEAYRSGIDVNSKIQDNISLPGSLINHSSGNRGNNSVLLGYSYLNFQKNVILIYDNLLKLSKNQTVIMINSNFNDLLSDDNETMHSLLEGEIIEYKKLIVKNFNNMVIPFMKKTSRENLSEYINVNWNTIENKQDYDGQVWSRFLEANNALLEVSKEVFVTNYKESQQDSSVDVLLRLQYDKLKTVNDSLIIKSITNNILLTYKFSMSQEIIINILLRDITSLKIEPKTLIEWIKFQDYTRLIGLLIYKDMNADLLLFNASEESIFKFQRMYQLETLTIQEIQKVWRLYM